MKGPFERLKYDLRRLWECPLCKRRERSDGTVTSRFCNCPGKGAPEGQRTSMKLLEEAGHRTVPEFQYQPPIETEPADVAPAQEPAPVIPEPIAIVPDA
ncbi:MAG: hypothetical protein K8R36_21735 [Planctomycetales bacterium]|nr:hypothetical protein [Planctomycetales bacterium]